MRVRNSGHDAEIEGFSGTIGAIEARNTLGPDRASDIGVTVSVLFELQTEGSERS